MKTCILQALAIGLATMAYDAINHGIGAVDPGKGALAFVVALPILYTVRHLWNRSGGRN